MGVIVAIAIDATTRQVQYSTISSTYRRCGGVLAELRDGWLRSQPAEILCTITRHGG